MNNYTSIKPATKEKKSATKNSIMRVFLVAVAILLQCYFLYLVLVQIEKNYEWVDQVARMAALLLCIALFSMNKTASMKMPWFILMLTFPIAGTMIYLIVG